MKSGLIKIDDKISFKKNVLAEWERNSPFWLEGRMKHIQDVKDKTINELQYLISRKKSSKLVIVDVGCGEGWLYRAIREADLDIEYFGLDFNKKFISKLRKDFANDASAEFILYDVEKAPPDELINKADIVVNAFNYFEVPNLEKAVENTTLMMKKGGDLIILTIDPVMQLLAVSNGSKDFLKNLSIYAQRKNNLGYRKNIVIGDKKTNRFYYGILYSLQDYIEIAKKYKLTFTYYSELLRPELPTPQIFQFIFLRKN